MRFTLAGVLAEARTLWRSDQELVLRIAAVLIFLPQLAVLLFLPRGPDLEGLAGEALIRALEPWIASVWPWALAAALLQTLGQASILSLLLDPRRPSVGEAIMSALPLLPGIFLVSILIIAAQFAGFFALILPGLYVMGRSFLILPSILARPRDGLGGGIIAGIRHTHRRGWMIALIPFSILVATQLVGQLILALAPSAGGTISPAAMAAGAAASLIAALSITAHALFQAATYRVLVPRQGI